MRAELKPRSHSYLLLQILIQLILSLSFFLTDLQVFKKLAYWITGS